MTGEGDIITTITHSIACSDEFKVTWSKEKTQLVKYEIITVHLNITIIKKTCSDVTNTLQ